MNDRRDPVRPLAGKTALVTGATSGIGRAIAGSLVGAGAAVVGCGRSEHGLRELADGLAASGEVTAVAVDLRERASIDALFGQLGALDMLINCAGVAPRAPLLDGSFDDFAELLEVNVLAVAYCCQLAVARFGAAGGSIVNVSSMSGHRVPPSGGLYAPTKFAVRALTEALRHELKAAGNATRVACVSPGFVDTPLLDRYFRGAEGKLAELRSGMRMLSPDDVAAAVMHIVTAPTHVEVGDILLRPADQHV